MELQWRRIHTIANPLPQDSFIPIRFSPDGETLFLGIRRGGTIIAYQTSQMWDVNTGELKKTGTENKQGILSIDGKTLVTYDSDGQTIQLWNVETGELTKTFTQNSSTITLTNQYRIETLVALSPDSQTLATYDAEKNLKLWNVSTGEVTYNLGQVADALSAVFSPNGQILGLHLPNKFAYFWDVNTGEKIGKLDNKTVDSIAFTSDNKALLIVKRTETRRTEVSSAGGSDWYENTYYFPEIWDALSGQRIGNFGGEFVGLSPDGQIAIGRNQSYFAGTISKDISLANFNGGQTIAPISGGTNAAFSPLANILGVVEEDGQSLKLLQWPSGAEIFTITDYIQAFAFSPDEMTLATVNYASITLWQNSTKPIMEQRLHGNAHPQLEKLENLLAAERWEDADDETTAILKDFPTQDLKIVDQLWVHYSKGSYGFSVQDEILELIQQNKLGRGSINNRLFSDNESLQGYLGWMTVQTNFAYEGVNDQFCETIWNRSTKGYYPRKGRYQLWSMSHLKG